MNVAAMAGLPMSLIETAEQVANEFESVVEDRNRNGVNNGRDPDSTEIGEERIQDYLLIQGLADGSKNFSSEGIEPDQLRNLLLSLL